MELVELRQKTVSFIFQEGNLLPHLSARDNVAQPLRHQGISAKVAHQKATEMLNAWMGHRPMPCQSCSLGEQQRLLSAEHWLQTRDLFCRWANRSWPCYQQRGFVSFQRPTRKWKGFISHSYAFKRVAAFSDRSLELRDGRFVAEHGTNVNVEDLQKEENSLLMKWVPLLYHLICLCRWEGLTLHRWTGWQWLA